MMRKIEVGALLALAFFLPLYEAPKSIAWLVYVVAWIVNRARRRDFGGPWDLWDTLIVLWIASGFVVAAFAGLDGGQWRATVDLVRYATVLWLLRRSDYSAGERRRVFEALLISALVGLTMGHWRLWVGGAEFLEVNSVGHVNHTAIYIAIMLGACVAWMFSGGGGVAVLGTILLLFSLVITASRAGVGVALAMLLVLGVAWWPRSRRAVVVAVVLVAVTASATWFTRAEVIRKHQAVVEAQNMLNFRDRIWNAALVAWQRYPLFGIGMDNYGLVKTERVKAWRTEAGKPFDAADYAQWEHAHSLYLNALAERGIVGSAPLAAILIAWLACLWRTRPARETSDDDWIAWGAAMGAWMITTGVGLVNTTLHHEHGILAMLFLGLWLSTSSGRSSRRS